MMYRQTIHRPLWYFIQPIMTMMKYMMMSEMFKGKSGDTNSMLPMIMMMNGGSIFDGMFDFGEDEEEGDK